VVTIPTHKQTGLITIHCTAKLSAQCNKLCRRPTQYAPHKLTFDLLTLKVVSESRVTRATSVPTLVFLGLSVLDLGPMYATDRQTDVRGASSLNAPYPGGHNDTSSSSNFQQIPAQVYYCYQISCMTD